MRLENTIYLIRRSMRSRPSRLIAARIGVGFAAFFLTLGLGAILGVQRSVQPALEQLFPPQRLLVRPASLDLSILKVQTGSITDAKLDSLRKIPGISRAFPQMPIQFPIHARGRIGPMTDDFVTEIVIHGVPRELIAGGISAGESFEWRIGDERPCPCIVSSYFMDLYNLGLAESNGLPRLNESALRGRKFTLVLGSSTFTSGNPRKEKEIKCQIVGFTRDPQLAGVALPISAVRAFHEWYFDGGRLVTYNMVQLEVNSTAAAGPAMKAIGEMGLLASSPGQMLDRWRWTIRGVLGALMIFGGGFLALALAHVASAFAMMLAERREEMGLFMSLGAPPRLLRRLYAAEAGWAGFSAALGGALPAWAAAWMATRALRKWVSSTLVSLPELSITPDWRLIMGIFAAVTILSVLTVYPLAIRASRRLPAALLRDS